MEVTQIKRELSQIELASRMDIEPATLVRVLDRMERDGLVARSAAANDRRRNVIKPLAKAKPMWKKITTTAERVRERVIEGLSPRQIATFKEVCRAVQANLAAEESGVKPKATAKS